MGSALQPNRVFNKRPLVWLAICFAPGIVLGRYFHFTALYLTAALVIAAAAVCLRLLSKSGWSRTVMVLALAAFALLGSFLSSCTISVPYLSGGTRTVTGHIYSTPIVNEYGSVVCLLDNAQLDGQDCGNVKLYSSASSLTALECGNVICATAEVEIPDGVRNPGGFDERLYLLSENIHYKAYADNVMVTGARKTLTTVLNDIRVSVGDVMERVFAADTAPLAKGMLLGDKQSLDEDIYGAFKDTGMAHVLAVSGLHAAILIAVVYGFFRLIRLGRIPTLVATLVFIAVYALVTGLTPSILRASVMAIVLLLGKYFGRQTDTLSSLALAFIISLFIHPLDLFMAGFQLSFSAVFGLLTLGSHINRMLKKALPSRLSDMISASVGATAGTIPILAASFNRLSVLSVIINIFVLPLASFAIVLTFITTFLALFIGQTAACIAFAADAVIRFMLTVIEALAVLPFAAVNVATPPWFLTIGLFLLLFIASKYLLVSTKLKALLGAGLMAAVLLVLLIIQPAGMTMTFLDVGQGDAAFVRTAQGGEYFVDGGPPKCADEIVDFTIRNGITPDAAFVSHTDDDHFAGLVALYEQGMLQKVYCSAQEMETVMAAMPKAEVVTLSVGDAVLLDDETRAVVLYPYSDSAAENKNDLSLVLMMEYKGHRALLTGDISGRNETVLFTTLCRVDIYKAAHHGSKYSSYRLPLSVLAPKYSVVSVGDNTFGHPHAWALNNLEDYSDAVFTTWQNHAVVFSIDDKITVKTYGG